MTQPLFADQLPEILEHILTSTNLPTLPVVASEILTLTSKEDISLAEIAEVAAQDMAMVSKILRVVNSSLYGMQRKITSINQAVTLLGLNSLRSLVLGFSFISMGRNKNTVFDFHRFWRQSLTVAVGSRIIAEYRGAVDPEEAFTAGLLQNIGQLIFACTIPDRFERVVEALAPGQELLGGEQTEQQLIQVTHSLTGAMVAGEWGLPESLQQAIRFHHSPMAYDGDDAQLAEMIQITSLASILAAIFYTASPQEVHHNFREQARQRLGFDSVTLDAICGEISKQVNQFCEFFELNTQPSRSVADILHEANLKLGLMAMSNEEKNKALMEAKKQLEMLAAELKRKNALLENMVNIDPLTNVANHRYLQECLQKEMQRVGENQGRFSLLLIDFDDFKLVNDTHGHLFGDFVLREFCRVTQRIIRNYDVLARYGGEEFIVLLPDTAPEAGQVVAEKIRHHIANHVFTEGEDSYHLTVSIGMACITPTAMVPTAETLIRLADQALYLAKQAGKNQVMTSSTCSG